MRIIFKMEAKKIEYYEGGGYEMKICDICNQEYEGSACVIFIPGKDYCHPFNNSGRNLFICIECNLCYLAQHMSMTSKEINEWLSWSSD